MAIGDTMSKSGTPAAEAAARALFANDRASQELGISLLAVEPGVARVTMQVRPDMVNGHGICHGGLIFTLADSAFAFACNSHGPATVAAAVTSGRTGLYDLAVTRADGTVIAHARGRSHRLHVAPPKTT
jgi:acyl-CoA thioesterase